MIQSRSLSKGVLVIFTQRCILMPAFACSHVYVWACISESLLFMKTEAFSKLFSSFLIFGALQNPECIPRYSPQTHTNIQASILAFTFVPGVRKTYVCLVCFSVPWDKVESQYTCLNPTLWIRDRLWRGLYWWLRLRLRAYTCNTFHLWCTFRRKVQICLLCSITHSFSKTKPNV